MSFNDFRTEHLDSDVQQLAKAINEWLTDQLDEAPNGGGCRAFYSPAEWEKRGEPCGQDAYLVLCHDGTSDLASFCSYDYLCFQRVDTFEAFLNSKGYYLDNCTNSYSAVHRL